ncbi:MAG TPA: sigma-70 family RNA polymerase sigma factor [Planctomycetota bacterium]|nr:sigma-70 family RNA polymerase sigma factor [Planctomycetota bacterium]
MASQEHFEELTRTIAPRVESMARRWCGPDAVDGAQEVHRELAKAWPGFRGDSAATTWAHRIAVRTLVRFAERQRRRQRREPNASELDLSLDEAVVADFRSSPFTALSAAERRERVHTAIARLSPTLRDTLLLRVIEGLDYAAIAETLELPLGTVKSRIAAATLRLAEHLQDLGAPV